jgi:hypothetical protein
VDDAAVTLDRVRHRAVVLPDERAEDLGVDARAQGSRAGEIEEDDGDPLPREGLPSAGQLVGAAVAEPGRVAVLPTAGGAGHHPAASTGSAQALLLTGQSYGAVRGDTDVTAA